MRTGVHISTIGAAVLMFATGSAVAADAGVLATYTYPIDAVRKAATDALTEIGCEIEKNQGDYIEGVRRHKFGAFVGSGGERVSVTLTSASEGITSVDIQTKKTFVGYAGQKNWDEAVRDGIRQHMLAHAARNDEPQAKGAVVRSNRPSPPPALAAKPKQEAPQQSSWVFDRSQSSAPNEQSVDSAAIARGLAVFAVVAADVFVASKGYAPAPVPVLVPPAGPQTRNPPVVSRSPIMCPDGSYVSRPPCMPCPNGHYVGGSSVCTMAPDGTFVPGTGAPQMAPDGTFHAGGGTLKLCPDGTYVTGTVCILVPNGHYFGN